jgi:hypothetical protein
VRALIGWCVCRVKLEVLVAVLGGVRQFTGSGGYYGLSAAWSSVLKALFGRGDIYLRGRGVLFLDCAQNNARYFARVAEITRHTLVSQFDSVKIWGKPI